MPKFELLLLTSQSAEFLRGQYEHDIHLPDKGHMQYLLKHQEEIPEEFRVFDLVFPRAIDKGMSEGGGADKVTDDSICYLIWDGNEWIESSKLAGSMGWGGSGPGYFGPRARVLRFAGTHVLDEKAAA